MKAAEIIIIVPVKSRAARANVPLIKAT
jgi:hypothetical protein